MCCGHTCRVRGKKYKCTKLCLASLKTDTSKEKKNSQNAKIFKDNNAHKSFAWQIIFVPSLRST